MYRDYYSIILALITVLMINLKFFIIPIIILILTPNMIATLKLISALESIGFYKLTYDDEMFSIHFLFLKIKKIKSYRDVKENIFSTLILRLYLLYHIHIGDIKHFKGLYLRTEEFDKEFRIFSNFKNQKKK